MFVTSFLGSPRKQGNTSFLINTMNTALAEKGARTAALEVDSLSVNPCRSCGFCEKKGYCAQKDDMEDTIFPLIKKADVIIIGAPVYFYNVPGPMKTMFDRCQSLWARKYLLNLQDPKERWRKGVLLSPGATSGKNLFDGIKLTVGYTLDAVGALLEESRCYRGIEKIGDMKKHPGVKEEIIEVVEKLTAGYDRLQKVLVLSATDGCDGPAAAAFINFFSAGMLMADHAGISPDAAVDPDTVSSMERRGFDIKFHKPLGLEDVLPLSSYDAVVSIHGARPSAGWSGSDSVFFNLEYDKHPRSREDELEAMENRVVELVKELEAVH